MKIKNSILLITALTLVISGCATIKLTTGGEKIRILTPDEVTSCKKLGKTNTSVTAKVLGIDRPIEALERELLTIARNSAASMGGDTIVPLTIIEDGQQTFEVYKCVNPKG